MAGSKPVPEMPKDPAREKRRRNVAIGLVLGGLVILFYVMTLIRLP